MWLVGLTGRALWIEVCEANSQFDVLPIGCTAIRTPPAWTAEVWGLVVALRPEVVPTRGLVQRPQSHSPYPSHIYVEIAPCS